MTPLTIEPIVPDDDDEPKPKKRKSSGSSSSRSSSGGSRSRSSSSSSREPEPEPRKLTAEEKADMAEKMKMRYGIDADKIKYEELPSKTGGKKKHRTGGR